MYIRVYIYMSSTPSGLEILTDVGSEFAVREKRDEEVLYSILIVLIGGHVEPHISGIDESEEGGRGREGGGREGKGGRREGGEGGGREGRGGRREEREEGEREEGERKMVGRREGGKGGTEGRGEGGRRKREKRERGRW